MSTSSNKYRRGVSATDLFHIQHFHTHTTLPQFFHATLPHTQHCKLCYTHTTLSHLFGTYWKRLGFSGPLTSGFTENTSAQEKWTLYILQFLIIDRCFVREGLTESKPHCYFISRSTCVSYGKGWRPNQIVILHQFLTIHARFVRKRVGLVNIDRHCAAAKGYISISRNVYTGVSRRSVYLHLHTCVYAIVDV